MKKANELSILCDIDIVLLTFSPTGKPSLCNGTISYWTDPKKINSIEHLVQIEDSLRESLDQVQTHKENIEKQQLTPLECSSQMGCIYPLEWVLTSSFNPYHGLLIMTVNKWFYPRNQTGFPKGSFFGSYSGYFGTGRKSETDISGQESGILNELRRNASMRLQLGGQYPYLPYDLNFLSEMKFQPAEQMNQQENHVDYHAGGSFEAPQPAYDTPNVVGLPHLVLVLLLYLIGV